MELLRWPARARAREPRDNPCCRQVSTNVDVASQRREGRGGVYFVSSIFSRLVGSETLGESPHVWSGSVHSETFSHGALFTLREDHQASNSRRARAAPRRGTPRRIGQNPSRLCAVGERVVGDAAELDVVAERI